MSVSIRTKPSEYVCTLSESALQKARVELNEDPLDRKAALNALREWILQQSYMKFQPDDGFLISFLRGAKFSQLRARKMITKYLTTITSVPEWFRDIDTFDPKLQKVLSLGMSIPLPKKDANGCTIIINRLGAVDPSDKTITTADEVHGDMVMGHYTGLDEETQVNGLVFIIDFTGTTMKHMTRWSMEDLKKYTAMWQESFPGRYKAFHYYNMGLLMEAFMAVGKMILTKKLQERIILHETMESIYKHVPMHLLPTEYLPDDYTGPSAGSIADIIRDYKAKVTSPEFRNYLLDATSDKFSIDLKRIPTTTEPQSSYRKLAVD